MKNTIKNLVKSALIGAVSVLAVAGGANAATVQIDPATIAVANGDIFDLTVVGRGFAEATTGGGFLVTWVPADLTLISTATDIDNSAIANGFNFNGALIDLGAGTAGVAVGQFPNNPLAGDFDIATLTFSALQPGVTSTSLGIFAIQNEWLGADGLTALAAQPNYLGAEITVNAVPVPAAVWLFGSGLLGMVGVARRRGSRAA